MNSTVAITSSRMCMGCSIVALLPTGCTCEVHQFLLLYSCRSDQRKRSVRSQDFFLLTFPYDPSVAVKLVGQEVSSPRHLDDDEEQALVAAVTEQGTLRDRVLLVLLLHTGLRAREVCRLRCDQVKLGKRSGFLEIMGKRNKYREVPLNTTARNVLKEYLATLPSQTVFLFPSGKTKGALSERALGYVVKKYADAAKLVDVSLHDLRHRCGYRMAESAPLHRLAQIMGHDSLDTTRMYTQGTRRDLQQSVETIAWT